MPQSARLTSESVLHRRDNQRPFRAPDEDRLRRQARESSLQDSDARIREQLQALRPVRAYTSALQRSCVGLLKRVRGLCDLHQRRMPLGRPLVQQLHRMFVLVTRECAAHHAPEAFQRTEPFKDRRRLIAATYHAVSALGVSAGRAVLFPLSGLDQFLVSLGITILQQITWPLP